jgi:hypothetical protein
MAWSDLASMVRGRRARARRLGLVASLALLGGLGTAAAAFPITTDEELVSTVERALVDHDEAVMVELINWEGASRIKRNLTMYQVRYGMGRPILEARLEPMPAGALDEVEAMPQLRVNMPVSHRLRITYDEPAGANGKPRTATFLVGRIDGAYRIAQVVRDIRRDDD